MKKTTSPAHAPQKSRDELMAAAVPTLHEVVRSLGVWKIAADIDQVGCEGFRGTGIAPHLWVEIDRLAELLDGVSEGGGEDPNSDFLRGLAILRVLETAFWNGDLGIGRDLPEPKAVVALAETAIVHLKRAADWLDTKSRLALPEGSPQ